MLIPFSTVSEIPAGDVCVVGAGPVGIALALACASRGLSVVLLESGLEHVDGFSATLTAGHSVNAAHAAPDVAICRGLGGTSRWWGGRCVAFDDIDFATRPHLPDAAWPIAHDEISKWYPAAAAFFGIGPARFAASVPASGPAKSDLGDISFDQLERWTPQIDAGARHRAQLASSSHIKVLLGATVTEIDLTADRRRVASLTVADRAKRIRYQPNRVVLACGGLETTRLLLATQQRHPGTFGGEDGPLGRGYMGHLHGKIANLVLADPTQVAIHDFFLDEEKIYARRRFTVQPQAQLREQLLNIAFWADNPPLYRPGHRNGVLSLVWLALALAPVGRRLVAEGVRLNHVGPLPHHWAAHISNIVRSPFSTAREIAAILHARFLSSPRKPGFLVRSRDGRYALHYIAEQAPNNESRVRLSSRKDALGLPFLDVNLRHTEADARSVLRAHELLDRSLRQAGLGRLDYLEDDLGARTASILGQIKEGYHQIGTTPMGLSPKRNVLDAQCSAHHVENLYVASSSVFPSSSQANPTFAAVALALRLAAHLADHTGNRLDQTQAPAAP